SAGVGFLVWDENRRYIAANAAACEILGTTLDALLGQQVGGHTIAGAEALEEALAAGFSSGRAVVERFDGRGRIHIFYATFATKTSISSGTSASVGYARWSSTCSSFGLTGITR